VLKIDFFRPIDGLFHLFLRTEYQLGSVWSRSGKETHAKYSGLIAQAESILYLECVRVEVLLKLLIREVDAQLLERVDGEDLKAEDIQDTDRPVQYHMPAITSA